eukprot:TRINITY_DN121799_c0_g1_i1.p1 TRINITY_DN121799_c0_g1~~TRINITY_DN121799_c0_g1_i1.p1  ORF type:complete len:533 (-),score=70.21 TRINITY_DN121799_c0_g1_i1:192-1790(-)
MSNGRSSSAKSAIHELYEKALAAVDEHESSLHSQVQELRCELDSALRDKAQAEEREQRLFRLVQDVQAELRKMRLEKMRLDQQAEPQAVVLPTSVSTLEWQFLGSSDEDWICMPGNVSAELLRSYEAYRKGGDSIVQMKSGVEDYQFDLGAMQQTNIRTRQQRQMRCKFSVPRHWTRYVNLQNVYKSAEPRVIEVAGFINDYDDINGKYTESGYYEINGFPLWWDSNGRTFMFVDGGSIVYMSEVECDGSYNGRHEPNRFARSEGGPDPLRCSRWDVMSRRNQWVHARGVEVSSCSAAGVPSVMEIAVEVEDSTVLSAIKASLLVSITHEDTHLGASECDLCRDRLKLVRVLQIENLRLLAKYRSCKEHMKLDLAKYSIHVSSPAPSSSLADDLGGLDDEVAEGLFFHGTSYETAVQIAQEGFDFRLSRPGYYGRGTYFASQMCKSHQYTSEPRCVILSRVALGSVACATKVDPECTRPPLHPGTPRCCDTIHARPGPMPGHSNGRQTHHEFVVFEKFQAYPEMIIEYYLES